MNTLTSKQRAHLRGLAQALRPVVHIGKDGVNDAVLAAVREALNTRELLKVRVLEAAPTDVRDAGHTLADQLEDVELVHVIGKVLVLYRPFPEHPEIRLPA